MRKMIGYIVASVLALSLSACSTVSGITAGVGAEAELPVKYAVAKVIGESDSVTGQGVMDVTAKVRGYVESDGELVLDDLMTQAAGEIDFASMEPADAMLVQALLVQIEHTISVDMPALPEERRVRILTLLDWIDEAAALYADRN
jgi:predicted small secreted protein